MKMFLRGACLSIVIASVGMSAPAFAGSPADATATTATITTAKPVITSGRTVNFKLAVTPAKVGKTTLTGSVNWTIVGADNSTVACPAKAAVIAKNGKSTCSIPAAQLVAGASPYTVTAIYSGDANFATSTATFSEVVTAAATHIKITYSGRPTSGGATTVYATVYSGRGTGAITGSVTFGVFGFPGRNAYCGGIKNQFVEPLVGNVATCSLPAGWVTLPTQSTRVPRPVARWGITATYNGTTSFLTIGKKAKGKIVG